MNEFKDKNGKIFMDPARPIGVELAQRLTRRRISEFFLNRVPWLEN